MGLGMTKNEAKILHTLYKIGTCNLAELSKSAKIHRANTYDAIDNLSSKALVTIIQKDGKKRYQAVPPENLLNVVKSKEMMVKELIPKLEIDYSFGTKKNLVDVKEGPQAIRDLFLSYLDKGDDIYTYGVPKHAVSKFGVSFQNRFHKMRISQKQKMYHIYNSDAFERVKALKEMKFTPVRMLPPEYDCPVGTRICGDSVTITFYGKEVTTVTFKNKDIAQAYKRYFFILWEKAKPFDNSN